MAEFPARGLTGWDDDLKAYMDQREAKQVRLVTRGGEGFAPLGDSLMGYGSAPGSVVMSTTAAVSAGATTLPVTNPYSAYPTQGDPAPANLLVIEPNTIREEFVVIPAGGVAGTAPNYTVTVPALTFAHPSGSQVRTVAHQYDAKSVPMWVHILSGGRMRFMGETFAHSSYTASHIQTVYLPQVVAAKPAVCMVLAGTNPGTYTLSHITDNVIPIWESLIEAGIVPLVLLEPPNNTNKGSNAYTVQRFNARLAYEAQRRGLPVVDTYAALVDQGGGNGGADAGRYVVGYNDSNVHWSENGAKALAQAIVTACDLNGLMKPVVIPTAQTQRANGDAAGFPLSTSTNMLLLADTNADGVPDGWTGANGGFALGAVAGIKGNAVTVTRPANATVDPTLTSPPWVAVPGHRYRVTFKVKTSGVTAAYEALDTVAEAATSTTFAGFDLRITTNNNDTDALFSLKTWKLDIDNVATIDAEYVHPKGLSAANTVLRVQLRGANPTPSYSVTVGEFLPVDLTALGVA